MWLSTNQHLNYKKLVSHKSERQIILKTSKPNNVSDILSQSNSQTLYLINKYILQIPGYLQTTHLQGPGHLQHHGQEGDGVCWDGRDLSLHYQHTKVLYFFKQIKIMLLLNINTG